MLMVNDFYFVARNLENVYCLLINLRRKKKNTCFLHFLLKCKKDHKKFIWFFYYEKQKKKKILQKINLENEDAIILDEKATKDNFWINEEIQKN